LIAGLRAALRQRLERWLWSLWWLRRPMPIPPEPLRSGVGGGDWRLIGEETARLAIDIGRLARNARVLDLGCGLGRLVDPLRRHLTRRGRYVGADVSTDFIGWNREQITARDPRFTFVHLDVRNAAYRPEGRLEASDTTLPFGAAAFDFALAISLFTHLEARAAERYLAELARVLAPGGTLFATFFLLDDEAWARIAAGRSDRRFARPLEHGATDDPALPENAIGFERDWLLAALARAGFALVRPWQRGRWAGEPGAPTYQDLVVAERVRLPK
jgi:SAM-dependent methyltransferase